MMTQFTASARRHKNEPEYSPAARANPPLVTDTDSRSALGSEISLAQHNNSCSTTSRSLPTHS